MKSIKLVLVLLVLLVLSACATGEKVRADLAPGMTRAQVISSIGAPDGVKSSGNSEVLQYTNRLMSGWSWDRADYFVVLKDGIVNEYGTGEVRQAPGGVFFIVH